MIRVFVLGFIFLLLFCSNVFSHPPISVKLEIPDEKNVAVTVRHPSINLEDHHIGKIEVEVNEELVIVKEITSQSEKEFTVTLKVKPLKVSDKVTVTAYCNKWGQRSAWLTVK